MVEITDVKKKSPAGRADIKKGDILISINGNPVEDVLDYMFYAADTNVRLIVKRAGIDFEYNIEKDEYDDLGLGFDSFLMDEKKSCRNKCVFCFIDQMPPGMRETLYFKDDDARLSFLQGNYVTLTNLKQSDIDRIIKMKLNINVSVHTTNPELRCKMMNNRFAGETLEYLKQMTDSGININCQIVLCPGLNDGDELRRTLTDLGNMMPNVQSIAVVPVGLSKFREGLYPLRGFDKKSAGETIDLISEFQNRFLKEYDTRLVFPSDEFYLISERELPGGDYYEEYPQYENGVGMLRSLNDEFDSALEAFDEEIPVRHISVATGYAAYENMCMLAERASEKISNLKCDVYRIRNDYFGTSITVAGLITARDLIKQLEGNRLGQELLISGSMLRRDSEVFLDDLTVKDVEDALNVKLRIVKNDGFELLDAMTGIAYEEGEEGLCRYR